MKMRKWCASSSLHETIVKWIFRQIYNSNRDNFVVQLSLIASTFVFWHKFCFDSTSIEFLNQQYAKSFDEHKSQCKIERQKCINFSFFFRCDDIQRCEFESCKSYVNVYSTWFEFRDFVWTMIELDNIAKSNETSNEIKNEINSYQQFDFVSNKSFRIFTRYFCILNHIVDDVDDLFVDRWNEFFIDFVITSKIVRKRYFLWWEWNFLSWRSSCNCKFVKHHKKSNQKKQNQRLRETLKLRSSTRIDWSKSTTIDCNRKWTIFNKIDEKKKSKMMSEKCQKTIVRQTT